MSATASDVDRMSLPQRDLSLRRSETIVGYFHSPPNATFGTDVIAALMEQQKQRRPNCIAPPLPIRYATRYVSDARGASGDRPVWRASWKDASGRATIGSEAKSELAGPCYETELPTGFGLLLEEAQLRDPAYHSVYPGSVIIGLSDTAVRCAGGAPKHGGRCI